MGSLKILFLQHGTFDSILFVFINLSGGVSHQPVKIFHPPAKAKPERGLVR